ncbi:serine--tRNA ligase [Patescibacteria group bacterium]|nr:serine--tRNA ligase [Patescibacteria group bacterium]MBU1705734.1 serine--tRNA ligase [Patescibacteria group bacterium]
MIDSKLIQEQPDLVAANNQKRGAKIDISAAQNLLSERSSLIGEVEKLRAQGNEIAGQIPKVADEARAALVAEGKNIKDQVKVKDEELNKVQAQLDEELHKYPNVLREDVPEGSDESANQEMRKIGEPPKFEFEVKDHLELGENLGLIDVERAAKISGSRFAYFKGEFVQLEFALINYVLSVLVPEGFRPVLPPHIISTKAMRAMGYLDHGGEEEVYHLKNDDAVLIGTSEQAVGPMFMDEMIAGEELPLRFVAFSPCYRREAGSYGKDVRGILRMHQFDKLEMFSYVLPEQSDQEHEFLLAMQERLMQGLKLPYRVMKLSAGDTGAPSARTYDIETWMPSQNTYRETHSTSNTTDYQSRRLNTRYKNGKEKGYVHMLNGTAFAIGRIMIAIMENYQQAEGSIEVPDILRPWLGKDKIGS